MLYKNPYFFVIIFLYTGPNGTGSSLTDDHADRENSYNFIIQYNLSYCSTISFLIDTQMQII